MVWIARDENRFIGQTLFLYKKRPVRSKDGNYWTCGTSTNCCCALSSCADEKFIGRHITWMDDPIEI